MGEQNKNTQDNIKALVEKATEETVKKFLLVLLKEEPSLIKRFKGMLGYKISAADLELCKKQIHKIFSKYIGDYEYMDYHEAVQFTSDMIELLNNDIKIMLQNQQYEEVFDLSNYVLMELQDFNFDYSEGDAEMVVDQCVEIWLSILEECDMGLKNIMFRNCIEVIGKSIYGYVGDCIENVLFDCFVEEEFLAIKLEFTGEKVCQLKKENDSWLRNHEAGKWAIYHIDIMIEQKVDQSEIEEYCQRNINIDKIRQYYIDLCVRQKRYDTAIRVLLEGKEAKDSLQSYRSSYSKQLKDLYGIMGDTESYKTELWSLLMKEPGGSFDVYKELKAVYDDKEWEEKREIIFEKFKNWSLLNSLYVEEQLYDRLLKVVIAARGLHQLTLYEEHLKNVYPEEILAKYESEVAEMAKLPSNRDCYKEIVKFLKVMKEYPKGTEKVDEIVAQWRSIYRNRRAMMDELTKL